MSFALLTRFEAVFQNFGLPSDKPVLLALSGGSDSIALFHLFRLKGIRFGAAHVNYGLRGAESDEDARFCRQMCEEYGISFFLQTVSPGTFAKSSGIQEKAREIRYDFFRTLAEKQGFSGIFTAHQAEDRTETVLLQLFRGTGMKGLIGMKDRHDGVYRPLLDFTKVELMHFLEENAFSWREDSSNLKNEYSRNRIRNKLMPLLRDVFPTAEQGIRETASHLAADTELFDFLLKNYGLINPQGIILSALSMLPPELRATAIFHVSRPFGLTYDQAYGLSRAASGNMTGKTMFTATHRLLVDRDLILIAPLTEEKQEIIYLSDQLTPRLPGYSVKYISPDEIADLADRTKAYLDADTLTFPLVWRIRESGDRMQPLGMKGSKKVSDLLTDQKINRFAKERTHVLISGGKIVWLEGIGLADSSKISPHTSRVLAIIPEKS
jgi:tRNA(Ile)-lysidine synthase